MEKIRATRVTSVKRYLRMIFLKLAQVLPLTKSKRTLLYRLGGVSVEKGIVRIGRVSFDTVHPEDIHIGKGSSIADGCIIITHFYDVFNMKEHAYFQGEIHIGRNVYIGSNSIITKAITIGDGAIVGAGSIINKDIPPYQVWAGVPAKFICNRYKDPSEIPTNTDDFKPM